MAAVLTRLLPTSSGRLLTRQSPRKHVEVMNREAFRANSIIAIDPQLSEDISDASGSLVEEEEEIVQDVIEAAESPSADSEYNTAEEEEDARTSVRRAPARTRRNQEQSQRRRSGRRTLREDQQPVEDDEEDDENEDNTSGSSATSDNSSASEEQWTGESPAAEEIEIEVANPNRCIFCGQDEENDPSEEFEEYLACAVCGDNAHGQCAREEGSLLSGENGKKWHCPGCVENGLQSDDEDNDGEHAAPNRRRSSVPKMSRDLMAASKPGAHTVFGELILKDDPQDGSRALRKRRISSESHGEPRQHVQRKRQKRSVSVVEHSKMEEVPAERMTEPAEEVVAEAATEDPQALKRTRPHRKSGKISCKIIVSETNRLILAFVLNADKLTKLEHELKKKRRRERDRARRARQAEAIEPLPEVIIPHYPAIQAHSVIAPFYAFGDREGDETKSKPYGGILTEAEADTSRTFPQVSDRKKFEDARQKAEEDWQKKIEANAVNGVPRAMSKVSGPPSKIKCISFGKYEIDTWHAAPYPEEYSRNRVLYICEFCLKYMSSDYVAWRHKLKCPTKHPPGDEIYRDGNFSFFEVDGRKNPVYCQNLCLLAKLFLGSKTLYYDVEPFLFYIMTEHDQFGEHFVGYFSKEKRPSSLNNVSCILVLPIHQRRGFGHMLIEFSYLLTKVEKKTGSPEKPLSDMGLVSYRSYWRLILCRELLQQKSSISITDLSDRTGMTPDDVVSALEGLRALVRDPVTRTYALRLDFDYFTQYIENYEKKGYPKIDPEALCWVPYVMGRDNMHYEGMPHLHTVAQRDDATENATAEEGVQMEVQDNAPHHDTSKDKQCNDADTVEGVKETGGSEDAPDEVQSFPNWSSEARPATPLKRTTSSIASESAALANIPIPPIRFEVFPPLPGTTAKRKPGRPFGSGRKGRRTPLRSTSTLSLGDTMQDSPQAGSTSGPSTIRRARSRLAESVVNGAEDDGDKEDRERAVAQFGDGGNGFSKDDVEGQLAQEAEDMDAEGDAEGDGDCDAEGDDIGIDEG